MEYIQNKLTQLAGTLVEPIWTWIMGRSWGVRACVFTAGVGLCLAGSHPAVVSENFQFGISTLKVAMADGSHIALDPDTKEKLSSTTKRLGDTVKIDLTSMAELVPWSAAQAVVALADEQEKKLRPYARSAISLIRDNETGGCFCWAEIPSKDADGIGMFIAGWVMVAFSGLKEEISDNDVASILRAQTAKGWWPIFRDKTDGQFASTYATAWVVLGLAEISKYDLISSSLRQQANDAVARGVSWLLTTRTASGKWKPYPNMPDSKESDSISGLVLHTLHVAHPSDLRALDESWLSALSRPPPEASVSEGNYVELRGSNTERIDHFAQLKLPWMLIATVDAYPNGDIFQKGRARLWIDTALSESSVITADANTNNWWRAELLYALRYLQKRG